MHLQGAESAESGQAALQVGLSGEAAGSTPGGTPGEERSKARISQRQEGDTEGLVHWAVGI